MVEKGREHHVGQVFFFRVFFTREVPLFALFEKFNSVVGNENTHKKMLISTNPELNTAQFPATTFDVFG